MIPDEISNAIQLYKSFCKDDHKTERKLLVESLYLLYLLVSNDLPTFHAEVLLVVSSDLARVVIGRGDVESVRPVLYCDRGLSDDRSLQQVAGEHAASSRPHLF